MITKELVKSHGLTEDEYAKIVAEIGREPNITELGVFSAMWNEHVSYKSSRIHLKKFPTTGEFVVQGPGENAGIIDIGGGWCVCFKMESHNHPSYIEPFQGAATGVGGILRDIFTMGARPIANLNSLRFGDPSHQRTAYLVKGVVSGIAFYGNCMGVPTVGGETFFDATYNGNCLVNAFTIGIMRKNRVFLGRAGGAGNPVIYVGSKTGRDGIHGASMASESFSEESLERRPTVQVGDPFTEKKLLEACLELMETDHIVGIQDMGAAGLTCSSFEMASRGGCGMRVNLDRVPMRAKGMTPYELLLSESQERMLIVARKGSEGEVGKIFEKWDLDAVVIGEVVEGDRMEMFFNGEKVVDLPVKFLTDEAPIYDRKYAPPANLEERRGETQRLGIHAEDSCRGETQREAQVLPSDVPVSSPFNDILLKILSSPNIASKSYVFKQYDHMVQARSVCLPERGDAAVLRVMEAGEKGIAITVEGNGRLCYLDPYAGSAAAVAEGVRNLACTGARAIGITDCLNFGNPERPDVMWEFVESVRGIADACKAFRIPVISGNVSLYNETEGVSIYPTPTIGIVGILDDVNKTCGSAFRKDGDIIALLGLEEVSIAGSEYQRFFHEACRGKIPQVSLEFEKRLSDFLVASIREGLLESAHDVSEGGLAVTLAECSLYGGGKIGFSVEIARPAENAVENLFGEGPSRVVISFEKKKSASLLSLAEKYDIPLKTIGQTGGDMITIKPFADVQLIKAFDAWANGFTETLKGKSIR